MPHPISLPLEVKKGRLTRTRTLAESIDRFLAALIGTPIGSCVIDPSFGFVFNNLRFEIFNENEGVVFNTSETPWGLSDALYEKKISGTSKNLDTFASELREAIERTEKRLTEVNVSMSYIRANRHIVVTVKGTIRSTSEPYKYTTTIRTWN